MNTEPTRRAHAAALVILLLSLVPGAASAQQHTGTLGPGDPLMEDDSYYDTYYVEAQSGQQIDVLLTSGDFDAFLHVYAPSGAVTTDDDSGGGTNARVTMTAGESGRWRVAVNSLSANATGSYEVTITVRAGAPVAAGAAGGDQIRQRGSLGPGDPKMDDNSYYDTYYFEAQPGQRIDVTLTSSDFDTYLHVYSPSDNATTDDDGGGNTNSRVSMTANESGRWRVLVNALSADATGDYEVTITVGGAASAGAGGTPLIRQRGSLGPGDQKMEDDSYFDTYYFNAQSGQQIDVLLTSGDFDTFLHVYAPSGAVTTDDDGGGNTNSRVSMTANESGQWRAAVNSLSADATGDYEVTINVGGAGSSSGAVAPASSGGANTAGTRTTLGRTERGTLQSGDRTLTSGELVDYYTLEGRQGEQVVLDLQAATFDPYLILKRPNGEQFDNDDYQGSSQRSLLSVALPESGTYQVLVTTYRAGESGAYTLAVSNGAALTAGGPRVERGRLEASDRTLADGEYVDTYTFNGSPGQRVRLDLAASDFDAFLILKSPGGEQVENDDAEGSPGHSVIEQALSESGTYTVGVTSYAARSTGAYELNIDVGAASAAPPSRQQDVAALGFGERVSGRLEAGDLTLDGGEYRDVFVFDGTAGRSVSIEMNSSDFDPYLVVMPPSGEAIQNDDFEGSASRSRVELKLPESGRYRVVATSYAAGQAGGYALSLGEASAAATEVHTAVSSGRNVYGIFVGVSDYNGRANNLAYTAEDATLVRDALVRGAGMRPENGIVLTDASATTQGFRQAVQSLSGRMGADDLFVFFFSGHGGRYPRDGFQPTDPDNVDESLEFYDAEIKDDDFSALLDGLGAGTQLLVVDACFSGGFSKDAISRPGRMGMFSSEEDVTSNVAAKFRAGGYLSQFFAEAVGDGLADEDGDGQIAAIELSQFVYERYRGEVKSASADDVVIASSRQMGYQKLVVDRGSVGPYDALFQKR